MFKMKAKQIKDQEPKDVTIGEPITDKENEMIIKETIEEIARLKEVYLQKMRIELSDALEEKLEELEEMMNDKIDIIYAELKSMSSGIMDEKTSRLLKSKSMSLMEVEHGTQGVKGVV